MTVLGKLLVFFTTLFALFALSLALWSYTEDRDLEAKAKHIGADIKQHQVQMDSEFKQLRQLVEENVRGARSMPYDPGDPYGREKAKTVKQIKEEIATLDKEVATLAQQWERDSTQLTNLSREMRSVREDVTRGLDEQRRLRETIANLPAGPALRDMTRTAWTDMGDTDDLVTRDRPKLMSEVMQLMSLQQRNAELKKRLDQLQRKPIHAEDTAARQGSPVHP